MDFRQETLPLMRIRAVRYAVLARVGTRSTQLSIIFFSLSILTSHNKEGTRANACHTATLGTVGDVVLADISQYLVGEEVPDLTSSIHVRFVYNEGFLRFRWRIDGQPAWASPVTPKNSRTTQSPFVVAETRN